MSKDEKILWYFVIVMLTLWIASYLVNGQTCQPVPFSAINSVIGKPVEFVVNAPDGSPIEVSVSTGDLDRFTLEQVSPSQCKVLYLNDKPGKYDMKVRIVCGERVYNPCLSFDTTWPADIFRDPNYNLDYKVNMKDFGEFSKQWMAHRREEMSR